MKTIHSEVAKYSQGIGYMELIHHGERTLRVAIYRDSHPFQSTAKVELFDGSKWNALWHIPYPNMQTPDKLNPAKELFDADRATLIQRAMEILS